MGFVNKKLVEFNNFLVGKKVAIIGLGVSNMPLLDYLHDLNADITVFDNKEMDQFDKKILDKLVDYEIGHYFGEDSIKWLRGFDIIFRSPSCLPTTKQLVKEKQRGAIITTEVEMVVKLAPCKVIGVTGSDGKTTTTTLISEILKEDGYNVFLGGNIGKPIFTEIKYMTPDDVVVLELSSFQLMGMDVSPNISIVTNITPNHLDKHKDYEEYIESKANIFKYQGPDDLLIINHDYEVTRSFNGRQPGKVLEFSSKEKLDNGFIVDRDDMIIKSCENGVRKHIYDTNNMTLRGVHNFENACCAIMATKDMVKMESIKNVLDNFKGVEHRLELVLETKNRVKWINDSVSSSPTRTIAGLNSFNIKNIVLIAGGKDKNLDYSIIGKPIVDSCKALVLLGQTADKIEEAVKKELKHRVKQDLKIYRTTTLVDAIKAADELSETGDIVLFSPASTSFDMFKNFAERGEMFKMYVKDLIK
jgi:UDP-N-acetylmuramoylalanine--D-glutamate ligase